MYFNVALGLEICIAVCAVYLALEAMFFIIVLPVETFFTFHTRKGIRTMNGVFVFLKTLLCVEYFSTNVTQMHDSGNLLKEIL